ncbi:MAG: MarC family protein [Bacteroidota bacterium]
MEIKFQHFLFAILALANSISAIPMFIRISKELPPGETNRLSLISTLTAFLTMVVSMLTGTIILQFFGISLDAFRVAGGILLAGIGYKMMNDPPSETLDSGPSVLPNMISLAVIPIGIPLTTGPGVITTVIVFSQGIFDSFKLFIELLLAILVVTGVDYLSFRYSHRLLAILGNTGLNVFTRVFGLIVLAIGVQFVAVGVGNLFPELLVRH